MNVHIVSSIISKDTSSIGGHKEVTHMAHDRLETNWSKSEFLAFKPVRPVSHQSLQFTLDRLDL
jgi:hypothetical protein